MRTVAIDGVVVGEATIEAVGTVTSRVMVGPVIAAAGPALPARSVTEPRAKRGITVPAEHPVTANVMV